MTSSFLEVRTIRNKGRGVRATCLIGKGTILDETPALVFPSGQATDRSVIHRYTFQWTPRKSALALGVLSLVNHSFTPNAEATFLVRSQRIRFRAIRTIRRGEEVTISYNGDPGDTTPVGFRVR